MEQEKKLLNTGDTVYIYDSRGNLERIQIERTTNTMAIGTARFGQEQRFKREITKGWGDALECKGIGNNPNAYIPTDKLDADYLRQQVAIRCDRALRLLPPLNHLTTHQLNQLAHFLEMVKNPTPGLFWTPASEPPMHENLIETVEADGNEWCIATYYVDDCVYYGQDGLMLNPAFWREIQPICLPEIPEPCK